MLALRGVLGVAGAWCGGDGEGSRADRLDGLEAAARIVAGTSGPLLHAGLEAAARIVLQTSGPGAQDGSERAARIVVQTSARQGSGPASGFEDPGVRVPHPNPDSI